MKIRRTAAIKSTAAPRSAAAVGLNALMTESAVNEAAEMSTKSTSDSFEEPPAWISRSPFIVIESHDDQP